MDDGVLKTLAQELDGVRREAGAELKRDIDKTLADTRDLLDQTAAALAHAGRASADRVGSTTAELAADVRERAANLRDGVWSDMRQSPLATLGIAAAVGLAVGVLVGRRT